MEMPDYINQQPSHEQKCSSNTDRTGNSSLIAYAVKTTIAVKTHV